MKALFIYKDRIAADAKIPFLERRQLLSKEVLKKMDERSKKRANKAGWTKGGKDAIYVTEGGHSISACPVMKIRTKIESLPENWNKQAKVTALDGRIEYADYENNEELTV